jgi:eukaryotic-like serine/threonine-protein kinase
LPASGFKGFICELKSASQGGCVDPDHWQRAKELFGSALALEPAERSAFLAQACSGDETLRQEIESLLAAHEEAGTTAGSAARDSLSGRRIGPYQLMHRIGQGGMAMVYLATRADDQYRKCVAIKLILPGLHTDDLLRRFRNERQTLAALDHPNIVKLLDGGETEDHLPYLVMDYVEGTPVTDYCDAHRLSTTERLLLFRTVCGAISYAHQRLVIHRDLKPGNILVTVDGTPKLLDFGIAKLLNPEAAATLVVTQAGQRLMTPDYASPEQVRGEPLTNSTDVYSLGVVLYELLTGHRPYTFKTQSPLEIERTICEEAPVKPSTAATRIHERTTADGTSIVVKPEAVSRTREGDPKKLSSRLHGDLDAIVMMALRKEPQRRYSSVYEFSEDIRHHLAGLPVKARPSTLSYRTSKFVRRHKEAAVLALLVLVLAAGVSIWQQVRSGSHPSTEVQKPRILETNPRRSVAVLGFKNLSGRADTDWLSTALSEMLGTELGAGEQMRTVPGEVVAQTKRDLAIPDTDALAPATLAKLRNTLNADFVVLGSYLELANGKMRLDLRLQDTQQGQTIAEAAETGTEADLFDLITRTGADLRKGLGISALTPAETIVVKTSLPSSPEAARLYAEGLAKLRASDALNALDPLEKAAELDPGHPLIHRALAETWANLGYDSKAKAEARKAFDLSAGLGRQEQLWVEGQYRTVSAEWDKAVEAYRALVKSAPDNLEYGLQLAQAQRLAGKGKDALTSLATLHRLPPPAGDDPRIDWEEARTADSLGDYQNELSSATKAEEKARQLGARRLVADALLSQGVALGNLGKPQDAIAAHDKAIEIYRELHDQQGAVNALADKAAALSQQGYLSDATKLFEEALSVYLEIGNKRNAGRTVSNIGFLRFSSCDLAGARKSFEQSVALSKQAGDTAGIAAVLVNLGEVMLDQGDLAKAESTYLQAQTVAKEIGNGDLVGFALMGLGNASTAKGDLAAAEKQYSEALQVRTKIGERGMAAETQSALAQLALEQRRAARAEALVREAREEFRKEQSDDDELAADAVLARALLDQGRPAEAKKEIDAAAPLVAKSQSCGTKLGFTIAASRIQAATGNIAEAKKGVREALLNAQKYGFLTYQFEARLALAELEMQSGNKAAARSQFLHLEQDARTRGFGLIADKAAAGVRS